MKIGFGYDVHKLVEGRPLILGGVHIPFEKGLLGHSDADALIHAIIDSLLGAADLGDIGTHFPDNDEAYKNISSVILLEKTSELLKDSEYKIVNIDATVVLEKPKLIQYIADMKEIIADKLDIETNQISIKATREEGMGFVGNGEGIKAFAVCLIEESKYDKE
ncbi:MAG: 2-C-methyl-D-erythritol 2,4-cyclodiphosphate synthase [Candidatus Cloacimonas sp. 4484_140]|nr:MAG: 2-C-methyl-D-erythritol 2,4-cyclodiphosphate synthase [Candidatus Cloacimonas sp. 4484_140]